MTVNVGFPNTIHHLIAGRCHHHHQFWTTSSYKCRQIIWYILTAQSNFNVLRIIMDITANHMIYVLHRLRVFSSITWFTEIQSNKQIMEIEIKLVTIDVTKHLAKKQIYPFPLQGFVLLVLTTGWVKCSEVFQGNWKSNQLDAVSVAQPTATWHWQIDDDQSTGTVKFSKFPRHSSRHSAPCCG